VAFQAQHKVQALLTISAAAVLIGSQLLAPSPVAAASFHQYSHAWDTGAGSYSGLSVYRVDQAISGIPSDGCGGPIQGSPVYQTQWLWLVSGSAIGNVELGTGHQCNDTLRYWYWGYTAASTGVFYLLGYRSGITEGASHYFQIEADRASDGHYYWNYIVSGTVFDDSLLSSQGSHVDTGLESYASGAVVPGYSHGLLEYKLNNGTTWTYWSGQDGSQVNGPTMCGHWSGATTWYAGENVSSC